MVGINLRVPRESWLTATLWAFVTTIATTAISTLVASLFMLFIYGGIEPAGFLTALILPIVLTPPVMAFLCIRHLQLKNANEELQKLAYRDSLLDCMNRRGFTASLEKALRYASPQRPCALLIVDADNFKKVNDQFGHDQGDFALKIILGAIKSSIRSVDMLGRLGGEEFGIFLPSTNEEQAQLVAKRICGAVTATIFMPEDARHRLSVSIGGAVTAKPVRFETLFRTADQRLYAAKQSGRNRVDFDLDGYRKQENVA